MYHAIRPNSQNPPETKCYSGFPQRANAIVFVIFASYVNLGTAKNWATLPLLYDVLTDRRNHPRPRARDRLARQTSPSLGRETIRLVVGSI
jgi:hypothetical protein